jgi:phage FluMu protein Com
VSWQPVRCGKCGALLFRAKPNALADLIEIKCRRCGTFE